MARKEDINIAVPTNYFDELSKLRTDYGQRIAGYPQQAEQIRSTIYGGDKVLPTLRSTRDDAIMSLYDVDKRLAERYANPSSETFIRDPYKREQLAAGQHRSVLGSVTGADRMVNQREDMLGNLLDKSLELLKLQIDSGKTEYDMLLNEAKLADSDAGAGGLDMASLLALLGKKGTGTTTATRPATGADQFRARVLAGDTAPAVPDTSLTLWDKLMNAVSGGINLLPTQTKIPLRTVSPTKMSVKAPVTTPEKQAEVDKMLQLILSNPPGTKSSDFVEPIAETSGIGGLDSSNLGLLEYVSGASPKLGQKIAEKYVMDSLFPEEGKGETPAKRETVSELLSKVTEHQADISNPDPNAPPPNDVEFYNQMVSLYPELTSEEIYDLLKNLGYFAEF